jgi:hypothetical protein
MLVALSFTSFAGLHWIRAVRSLQEEFVDILLVIVATERDDKQRSVERPNILHSFPVYQNNNALVLHTEPKVALMWR